MLSAIVRFSLRFRGVVIALACVLLGYGVYSLTHTKYDVFPEFAPPIVEIQTEAPGLSSEQVESLVTMPLENALTGIPRVTTVRTRDTTSSTGRLPGRPRASLVMQNVHRPRQPSTTGISSAAAAKLRRARGFGPLSPSESKSPKNPP